MSGRPPTVHAGCVLIGAAGVLIRGPSGSGKSALALDLLADAAREGRYARLVADDRVHLSACHGRLVARPHENLAGRIEARHFDVVTLPHAAAAVVRLVVDLAPQQDRERLRDRNAAAITLYGVIVPHFCAPREEARRLILVALGTNSITL